jgi:threonine aldolase
MRVRLAEDHETASYLAYQLAKIPQIEIDPTETEINMVFFKFAAHNIDPEAFVEFFRERNILVNEPAPDGTVRLVTHYWITRDRIDTFLKTIRDFVA